MTAKQHDRTRLSGRSAIHPFRHGDGAVAALVSNGP